MVYASFVMLIGSGIVAFTVNRFGCYFFKLHYLLYFLKMLEIFGELIQKDDIFKY